MTLTGLPFLQGEFIMINLSLLKSENGTINTFTDTPARSITQDELTDAEDQIADEEKDVQEDDTEYRDEHSVEEVQSKMEYGTPSGSDSSVVHTGCPGCISGNQDAADAAIIDAEITPVEATTEDKDTEEIESSDDFSDAEETSEDTGESEPPDLGTELKAAIRYSVALDLIATRNYDASAAELRALRNVYREVVPGNEVLDVLANDSIDISSIRLAIETTVNTLLAGAKAGAILAGRVFITLRDLGRAINDFLEKHHAEIRDVSMNIFTSSDYITNYWAKKFGKMVNEISEDELTDFVITTFQCKEWEDKLNKLTEINKFILTNKRIFLDDSANATKQIKELTKMTDKLGIEIDTVNDIVNTDKYNETRRPDTVVNLGFTPKKMSALSRSVATYLKIYKKNGENDTLPLIKKLEEVTKQLTKNSDVRTDSDMAKSVLEYEIKVVYLITVIKTVHFLIRELLDDFVKIGKGYEKIIDERNWNK